MGWGGREGLGGGGVGRGWVVGGREGLGGGGVGRGGWVGGW